MKTILLLSSFFVHSHFFAQYQATLFDTPLNEPNAALHAIIGYPNDESKLMLIQAFGEYPHDFKLYGYDESKNVAFAPTTVCGSSSNIPVELSNGILFGGNTYSSGTEPVFFDGVQSIIVDINNGVNGSDPDFFQFEERTFFTAFNGISRQLYEYLSPTNYIQISNELVENVEIPLGIYQNNVFYRTRFQDSICSLKKALFSNNSYSVETLRTQTGVFVNWKLLGEINSQFIISEYDMMTINSSDAMNILSFDDDWNSISIYEGNYFVPYIDKWNSVKINGELYLYLGSSLYKTTDGLSLSLETELSNEWFKDYFVLNEKIYFITHKINGTHIIYNYENSDFTPKYIGKDLKKSIDTDSEIYLTEWASGSQMSKYLKFNTSEELTTYDVGINFSQPNETQNARIWSGKPTFLWSEFNFINDFGLINMDIYQIETILGIDDLENQTTISVFPNPIPSGSAINVNSSIQIHASMVDGIGREVKVLDLNEGENKIETNGLNSGVYFIKGGNTSQKIIIQ